MNTFDIKVKDAATGEGVLADIYFLDGPNGNGIVNNGIPVALQTDANGNYTFTGSQNQIYTRVQSTGYPSVNYTLVPGTNEIKLGGIQGPTATITAARDMFYRAKGFLLLLAVLVAFYFIVKYSR